MFYIALNLTLIEAVREYVVPLFNRFFNVDDEYKLKDYYFYVFNVKNMV
jgi:hypothetical protein